jgi:glycerate 2-kinase
VAGAKPAADLCITEGKLDAQSLSGKTPIGVARLCNQLGVPCVALVGTTGQGAEAALAEGLRSFHAIRANATSDKESICERRTYLADRLHW